MPSFFQTNKVCYFILLYNSCYSTDEIWHLLKTLSGSYCYNTSHFWCDGVSERNNHRTFWSFLVCLIINSLIRMVWTLFRYIASPDKKVNENYLGPASFEEIARYLYSIHVLCLNLLHRNKLHLSIQDFILVWRYWLQESYSSQIWWNRMNCDSIL